MCGFGEVVTVWSVSQVACLGALHSTSIYILKSSPNQIGKVRVAAYATPAHGGGDHLRPDRPMSPWRKGTH